MTEKEQLPNLTVRDKLNVPYLLATQILTFRKAILNAGEHSKEEIEEAPRDLVVRLEASLGGHAVVGYASNDDENEDDTKNVGLIDPWDAS